MDLGDWLRSLGLGQYEAAFRENEIDDAVLPSLTAEDLKDLGVSVVGHRRKLLDAVAALRADASLKTPPAADVPPIGRSAKDTAERRQLTVMFCDLVGSTALSARLDPEDMREIMGVYHRCCATEIAKAGGFVAKYLGDGVLGYFGYPQAHEDDAERAVRSALSLIEAVPKLRASIDVALQVRLGIATGLVVVGDLIGEGDAQERGIVGDTPNLAARLQALAEPGQVVISNSTRRLTGGVFDYRHLGKVTLKGLVDPVPAWEVVGSSTVESRFEALRGGALTPLVGREEELELLMRRWQHARASDGSVVLVSGEPGIGKSRIVHALLEQLGADKYTRLRQFCSPHHQGTALHPTITQLERAAGFRRDDTNEQRLVKLEAVLGQATNDLRDTVPLLAELLSLPMEGRYPVVELTPQKRKEKTLKALIAQLEGLSARQPALMVVEDAQWIDPTSLELLDQTVDRVPSLPVLLIITFRPEFVPPWVGRPQVTLLSLSRLARGQRTEMLSHLTGGKALPKEIVEHIVDRTDGVPLFIEELTKAVVESGELADAGDHYTVAQPLSLVAIPATLHASLLARLDRLAPVREVAQIGAALGRHFSHEVISAVASMPQQQLNDALAQLVRAELVFRRGTPPDAEYTFKHALVQDTAYSTLLRGRRQELHARIVETLESRFREIVATQPALLAQHCTEAGLIERAVDYWRRAGELAMVRSAHTEAIRHFSTALNLVAEATDMPNRAVRELELCIKLGPALMMAKGTARPEVEAIYIRAITLGAGGDSPERFKALWGLFYYLMTSGRLEEAARSANELLGLAQRLVVDDLVLEAHHAKWTTSVWLGDLAAANANCQHGISHYDGRRHHGLAFTFSGHDPGVCAHSMGAISSILSGFPQRAMELVDHAVALARGLSHPYSVALAMRHRAIVLQIGRLGRSCRDLATELTTLSQAHDFPMMLGYGTFFSGWAAADAGEIKEGIALMERGLSLVALTGRGVTRPYMQTILACAKANLGNLPEAVALLDEALRTMEVTGERWWEAELRHVSGRLVLARGERDESEMYFQQSLAISRGQGAKSLELRTSTSLARLWRDQGKRTEAHDLLAPIYGWFTEGFDTADLKEARALLDELAS